MPGLPGQKPILDASSGDPLFPLNAVAKYAFRMARRDLNQYQLMARGNSTPSVRDALASLSAYFTRRGFCAPDYTNLSLSEIFVTGGGTTAAFNTVMQVLARDVQDHNRRGFALKPALLMPVPGYGYFADAAENAGMTVIKIPRDMAAGGVLRRETLVDVIRTSLADPQIRIVAYYDSNPHNPLGLVRGEDETRMIGDVIQALSAVYEDRDRRHYAKRFKGMPKVKGPMGLMLSPQHRWDGPAGRVKIIDDMVYDGLEYSPQKPVGFAQIPAFYKDTLTLFGPSKAGLVNLRAGLAIGDSRLIEHLSSQAKLHEYFPSKPALHALEGYFNIRAPFASQRERHLSRLNRAHRFNGLLMKALINGIGTMPEATAPDRRRLENAVMAYHACDRARSRVILAQGLGRVRVITTPAAGFFHVLDFSPLRGRSYTGGMVEDDHDLFKILLHGQNLRLASGSWNLLDAGQLMARASFAMPVAQVFDFHDRLRLALRQVGPAVRAVTPAPVALSA